MICPFRGGVKMSYIEVQGKEGDTDYLIKEQTPFYPECYGDDCPFYNWNGSCDRVERITNSDDS